MRRLMLNGDPAAELRAMAEADGWRPLAGAVRLLQDAGEIGSSEAARLLT
jgi:hypothetical protein